VNLDLQTSIREKEVFQYIIWTTKKSMMDVGLDITIVSADIGKMLESEP